jgi:O-acetyl-ADP-ribose deacetylase (regulator of RNase III)
MTQSGTKFVEVIQGDITRIPADAIVNAANSELAMGGGVCGAIFRAAGVKELSEACKGIGHCPTGSAVITPALGIASAKHIIHAVGPIYAHYAPDEARTHLRSAYSGAIRLAAENGCRSIAFPAISTGIYGYPLEEACREAVDVCLQEAEASGVKVKLVGFDDKTVSALQAALDQAR